VDKKVTHGEKHDKYQFTNSHQQQTWQARKQVLFTLSRGGIKHDIVRS
jgi:hypothetical protein